MFLFDLTEEQKELFIDLAIGVVEANGVVDNSEKELLARYCREMAIEYREKANNVDYKDVLKKLKEVSDEAVLRKISIEIIALMYADNDLAEEENEILDQIQNIFEFSTHTMGELVFVTKHLLLSLSLIQGITIRA